jgi:hypothetical protein
MSVDADYEIFVDAAFAFGGVDKHGALKLPLCLRTSGEFDRLSDHRPLLRLWWADAGDCRVVRRRGNARAAACLDRGSIGACCGRDRNGLWNMVWGRSAITSQALMRWRVALQFIALCLVMAGLYLSVK